jgi:hypothetical protein
MEMEKRIKKIGVFCIIVIAVLTTSNLIAQRKTVPADPVYEKKPGRAQCDGDITICICPEEVRSCECWIKLPA